MGRKPCCDKVGLKRGPWTAEEDKKLIDFILTYGQCCWRALPKLAGLLRCGKSCRLRWTNYLRPDLKRGLLSDSKEKMVIDLHVQLDNRWSKIASQLPGRTDNEIKNHWNTQIKKKLKKMGITHLPLTADQPQSARDHDRGAETPSEETTTVSVDMKELESNDMSQTASELNVSDGSCIDEVPLIDLDEILQPCHPSSSSNSVIGQSNIFEDLHFPGIKWPWDYNNGDTNDDIQFWDDDFDWNLNLLNEDGPRSETTTSNSSVNYLYQMSVFGSAFMDIMNHSTELLGQLSFADLSITCLSQMHNLLHLYCKTDTKRDQLSLRSCNLIYDSLKQSY